MKTKISVCFLAGLLLAVAMSLSVYADLGLEKSPEIVSAVETGLEAKASVPGYVGDVPSIQAKKIVPPKPTCVYAEDSVSKKIKSSKKCPPFIIPENKLKISLQHKANNVGSPVTFIVSNLPDEYVTGYEIYFGDDIVASATPSQILDKDNLLVGRNNIVFSHTYSAPNYGGYDVVFVLHTAKGTYKTKVSVPVWITGDADGDGVVNVLDAVLVAQHINSRFGSEAYDDRADLNNDDVVDLEDFKIVTENMSNPSYPEPPIKPLVSEPVVESYNQ